jgi:hypothetical protein
MRTGSHIQARFAGQREKEFTWFSLGASLPLVSMDAERAAHRIIEAVRARRPELILTPMAQVVARASGVFPGLTAAVLHLTDRLLLPSAAGASPDGDQPGHELAPAISQGLFDRLTALGRAAADRFNERPSSG